MNSVLMLNCIINNKNINNKNSDLRHAQQVRKQGGTVITNTYMLKPDSFKILLIDIIRYV
jgi:hypothetical protein